jgi:hypothetical protein
MNEPEDFGAELAQAAAQIHRLAQICQATGIRKGPESREILLRIKQLMDDTSAMIAGAPTQGEVDVITARFHALRPLMLAVMKTSGDSPQ